MISLEEIIIEKILLEKEILDIARKKVKEALEGMSCDRITEIFMKCLIEAIKGAFEDEEIVYEVVKEEMDEIVPLIMKRVANEMEKLLGVK